MYLSWPAGRITQQKLNPRGYLIRHRPKKSYNMYNKNDARVRRRQHVSSAEYETEKEPSVKIRLRRRGHHAAARPIKI